MIVETRRSVSNAWRSEQQFGRVVGGVLVVIGAWMTWGSPVTAITLTLLIVGGVLVVLGFVCPRALVQPNRLWMKFAEALSYVSTGLILATVFFLVVTPIGVVRRLIGRDPLGRRRNKADSYWVPYSERQHDPKHLEKMF